MMTRLSSEKGSVIVTVLVVLVSLTLLGLGAMMSGFFEKQTSKQYSKNQGAIFVAESGREELFSHLMNGAESIDAATKNMVAQTAPFPLEDLDADTKEDFYEAYLHVRNGQYVPATSTFTPPAAGVDGYLLGKPNARYGILQNDTHVLGVFRCWIDYDHSERGKELGKTANDPVFVDPQLDTTVTLIQSEGMIFNKVKANPTDYVNATQAEILALLGANATKDELWHRAEPIETTYHSTVLKLLAQ